MRSRPRLAKPIRRRTKQIATVAALAAMLSSAPFLLGGQAKQERTTASERLVANVNLARIQRGLKPLKYSLKLSRASRRWSRHLARTGRLVHAMNFRDGYDQAGEVLASGFANPTVAWLNSPGHRAIILARWARVAGAGKVGKIWTMRAAR